jgi:hypothetical protein
MSAPEALDRYIRLVTRAHNSFVFLRRFHKALRERAARLAAGFAPLRREADFAGGRFSAAMLRQSASIKLTTFSAEGFTAAGRAGRVPCFLRRMRTSAVR